jgi:hypothetical protein
LEPQNNRLAPSSVNPRGIQSKSRARASTRLGKRPALGTASSFSLERCMLFLEMQLPAPLRFVSMGRRSMSTAAQVAERSAEIARILETESDLKAFQHHLDEVISGEAFRGSHRSAQFLRYVVDRSVGEHHGWIPWAFRGDCLSCAFAVVPHPVCQTPENQSMATKGKASASELLRSVGNGSVHTCFAGEKAQVSTVSLPLAAKVLCFPRIMRG